MVVSRMWWNHSASCLQRCKGPGRRERLAPSDLLYSPHCTLIVLSCKCVENWLDVCFVKQVEQPLRQVELMQEVHLRFDHRVDCFWFWQINNPRNLKVSSGDSAEVVSGVRGQWRGHREAHSHLHRLSVLVMLKFKFLWPHRRISCPTSCPYADSSLSRMRPMTVVSSAMFSGLTDGSPEVHLFVCRVRTAVGSKHVPGGAPVLTIWVQLHLLLLVCQEASGGMHSEPAEFTGEERKSSKLKSTDRRIQVFVPCELRCCRM